MQLLHKILILSRSSRVVSSSVIHPGFRGFHYTKVMSAEGAPKSSLETGLFQKVILVTGASSGIGRSAAVEFFKNGCKVAITGRNQDALKQTSLDCIAEGSKHFPNADKGNLLQIVADLQNVEDCKRIVAETVAKFGQLDVLVNSAGILISGTIETLSLEDYDRQMNINTRSVFVTTQAAVPHLKKTKGNVVNVSSVNGLRSFAGVLSYNMSKAALDQFTRCTALELALSGVRVNSVNPGVTVTNVHRNAGMNEEQYQKFLEHSKSTHALGRVGSPEEVAKSIVFLASNELSGFLTGVTLSVDGGRGVMCPR